jgi:nucleoside phosphorylase
MASAARSIRIRRVLDEWKARGWKDHDNTASRIADALSNGATNEAAALEATRPFLKANRISRADVVAALGSASVPLSDPRPAVTAVVFTALGLEHGAMCTELSNLTTVVTRRGTHFDVGRVDNSELEWTVAVAQIGPGNLGAAAEATAAIEEFHPDLVMFVGIAGAVRPDLKDGTVIIADRVYYYEGGRADEEGWKSRPLAFPTSHRLRQHALALARGWDKGPVVVAPIAAGEALVGSARSEVGKIVHLHYNDAVGVDMESAGLYDAAHRAETPALAVRAVSDHLDDKSPDRDADRQDAAAQRAAAMAAALLRSASAQTVLIRQGES